MKRGIFVAGLREEIVASAEQILELMEFGECKPFALCEFTRHFTFKIYDIDISTSVNYIDL